MPGIPITGRCFEPNAMGTVVEAMEWAFIGLADTILVLA
jgi:hypothetical protein